MEISLIATAIAHAGRRAARGSHIQRAARGLGLRVKSMKRGAPWEEIFMAAIFSASATAPGSNKR